MRTEEIKVYKFNELSEQAQKTAVSKLSHINVEDVDFWSEPIIEDFERVAREHGFDCENVYFSGFSSQGDGAMFEYNYLYPELKEAFIERLNLSPMRKNWLINNTHVSGKGKHIGHYCHEKCVSHSIYWEVDNGDLHYSRPFYKWIESFSNDFENFIIEKYENLCRELYKGLEREYEYQTSEEAIIETIEANDFEFTEDGERFKQITL